jgi:hypothetical protein
MFASCPPVAGTVCSKRDANSVISGQVNMYCTPALFTYRIVINMIFQVTPRREIWRSYGIAKILNPILKSF